MSFRHTRDFSEISVNKINNLRKSDYPEIFRGAKNIFRKKKTPCNRYQKISTTVFWRIRPKLTFQKSVKTPIKKKVIGAFFRNCLRMKKPPIKFAKFGHWDIARGCGPGSHDVQSLPQSALDRSWVALGIFLRTQKRDHAHRQALGVLTKKMSVPRFQFYFFSPKPRLYFCELLWFWKWRRFLNLYPMKTISSRKSEAKSRDSTFTAAAPLISPKLCGPPTGLTNLAQSLPRTFLGNTDIN